MHKFKILFLVVLMINLTSCNSDNESIGTSTSSNVPSGKVTVTLQNVRNGKDSYNQEGCSMEMIYKNGLDTTIDAQVMIYELIHTKENYLQTGNGENRTLEAGETKIMNTHFIGFKCKQITGMIIQKVMCKTQDGVDCSDKFNYVNTDNIKFTVDLYPAIQ